jgi:cell division protein FtsB
MKTDSGLEEYAREKLYMKKEDEEIFIIEFDSLDE